MEVIITQPSLAFGQLVGVHNYFYRIPIIFYREFDDLLQLGELCEQFKTARAERRRGRRPKGKPKPDT